MDSTVFLLSFIIFAPVIAALVVAFFPKGADDGIKLFSLGTTFVVFLATVWIAIPGGRTAQFEMNVAQMQNAFTYSWMPSFNIYYFLGIDGISFPLVVLTSFLSVLAMWASWPITKHVKAYCCLFLLLETGMLGIFMALDFFLFYIFWEVMLLPMYFLIGVWGGPRREYAAIKFFLFTLLGGVFMLIAVLMIYFNSDLKELARHSDLLAGPNAAVRWSQLYLHENVTNEVIKDSFEATTTAANGPAAEVVFIAQTPEAYEELAITFEDDESVSAGNEQMAYEPDASTLVFKIDAGKTTAADIVNLVAAENSASPKVPVMARTADGGDGTGLIDPADTAAIWRGEPVHTFNMLALAKMGQHTAVFDKTILFGKSIQWWAFVLLFVGFIIKVPSVPVHTWLPDAHVEAPTPISMILAGVLLKMGGYGIIRICYPICPDAGYDLAWFVTGIGLVSMVYGAFAALAQKDFKRLVAYSSVSHMGYVVLGLGVWSAVAGQNYNPEYWQLGVNGAMFQMIAHGISSAGMFFMVGVVYDRVHHRNLDEFGGIFAKMPVYSGLSYVIFFAALGLPGLCGFIGEFFVTLSVWNYSHAMAVISASVVILTAGYILWTLQRVFLGVEYKGPHEEELRPITARELGIAVPLVVLAIVFGVYPRSLLDYMEPSVNQSVSELADWTQRVKEPRIVAEEEKAKEASQGNVAAARDGGDERQIEQQRRDRDGAAVSRGDAVRTDSGQLDVKATRPPSLSNARSNVR